MAYQAIGIGSSANDGTGDNLRVGADKVNDNFGELYNKLGNGTTLYNLTFPSGTDNIVGRATTDTLTNKTLTAPVLGGISTTASGNLIVKPYTNIVEVQGNGSDTEGQIKLNCHANSHGQTIIAQPHSESVTNTMLLPKGGNSTLVSEVATQTLTNKTLTSPDINTPDIDGGTIDGTIIGGATPAAVTGTAISGTSVTVTGTTGAVTLPTLTTTQRNALSAANGMVVYNSTDSKIQAYAGGTWVNLH